MAGWLWALMGLQIGCSDDKEESTPPLQPLIYTEYPELTPRGAVVRERRLQRQLVEGSSEGPWGRLDDGDEQLPPLHDPQALGAALTEALLTRHHALWEHAFISGDDYAELVDVGPSSAREFVDNQIGKSLPLWELFSHIHASEMPAGGLSEQFKFVELQLGSRHELDGVSTREDSGIAQYIDNQLILQIADSDVTFELAIERVFQIHATSHSDTEQPDDIESSRLTEDEFVYKIGSAIQVDSRLRTFLDAGLHLKPQLLRAQEYPFPMGVGSFWRYRRYDPEEGVDEDYDPLERRLDEESRDLAAEEVIVEVREVLRYGAIRLVELLRAYDDRRYTRVRQWWLLTPRRIYDCDPSCREHIEDKNWLLDYFQRQVPIMVFPLRRGLMWGEGGRSVDGEPPFAVHSQWREVKTSAGTFARTYRIEGNEALGGSDRYVGEAGLVRYFAPDRGVVRRRLEASEHSEEGIEIIEELVEYRLMD